ncbi:type III-B CRISPR module-associated protein Cmr5 [Nitrococcus mobilis]|uniref:CRISPR type III-B/RAMP module-associated protein Cmr5 n=1 Tax=Nitrococcus mobilis Nb-231 TaxID=314278 RepID=A4BL63_9GAMM|nr:type III-B CRISPR module-associated protein Cmr5 [Nitrococcus mobilis]EAR23051.1 hypothetical protein NB231_14563 [Nitrococcus mobilis Nb-231]
MTQTLEQQRAADAWQCAEGCTEPYTKLAKGLPALIMNSGLMQTLAFLEEKGRKERNGHHSKLGEHLRCWLTRRFPQAIGRSEFAPFMQALLVAEPRAFQQITAEALAWLRWVRQIAPAVEKRQQH